MNWMIDGAYGDLYRTAMYYPRQEEPLDEWEIERRRGEVSGPGLIARTRTAVSGLAAAIAAAVNAARHAHHVAKERTVS